MIAGEVLRSQCHSVCLWCVTVFACDVSQCLPVMYGFTKILFIAFVHLGIATILVKEVLSRLKAKRDVKGVYLHVLASNKHAIKFYESLGFNCCEFIPHYYTIMGHFQNAYCYILYVNGGHPPPSPLQVHSTILDKHEILILEFSVNVQIKFISISRP